jgi:putative methionine-R-sulfoxide reductase with GAF domain
LDERPDPSDLAGLAESLATCWTVESACETVTRRLFALDLLVSVYLLQGDRLRCRAVHGYWQIFDGMASGGVIGETYRSGKRMLVREATSSPAYLAAAPHVVDELCVPLVVRGAVVGVLNVETTSRLTAGQEQATDRAGALLAARLAELPLPAESAAQKLGRHGAVLSTLAATADATTLLEAVARAAVDISGMDSAALCVDLDLDSGPSVCAATGPFADRLRGLSSTELTSMAGWVSTGTSSYTVGKVDGFGLPGHQDLRAHGAGSAVVLPLRTAHARRGMLVVTTEQVLRLRTEEVQLLELLAATITTCLQIADNVQALRQRAAADALTGLGHHATFHAAITPTRQRAGATGWRC